LSARKHRYWGWKIFPPRGGEKKRGKKSLFKRKGSIVERVRKKPFFGFYTPGGILKKGMDWGPFLPVTKPRVFSPTHVKSTFFRTNVGLTWGI